MMLKARACITRFAIAALATVTSLYTFGAAYETISATDAADLGAAAGGDEIRKIDNGDGTYDIVHIFTSTTASQSFTVPTANQIKPDSLRLLAVGGGGSGGGDCGGGGGAGGLVYKENLTIASGTITVGAGGAGTTAKAVGNDGKDTTAVLNGTTYTALGGGGGGWWSGSAGRAGGSGGGAVQANSTKGGVGAAKQPSSATGGYGNAGATSAVNNGGGGGGGAGSAGSDNGQGGDGMAFDISGENLFYAAGGGGGIDASRSTCQGGSGIGGKGSDNSNVGATDGKAGTGSGGGGDGGGSTSFKSKSGAGGSGVVILRYTLDAGPIKSVGAIRSQIGSDTLLIFTNVNQIGSFTLAGMAQGQFLVVGGGGAGGSGSLGDTYGGAGGGGGAGGFVCTNSFIFSAGTYSVTVGRGGAAATDNTSLSVGGDGGVSFVAFGGEDLARALGGGGGGAQSVGNNGASGGGGSMLTGARRGTAKAGGSGADGQGFSGGRGAVASVGGAGGGAAAEGGAATATAAGAGGEGLPSSITGAEVYYAGGGAGGSFSATATRGIGGSGIGGSGGTPSSDASAGLDGTGSGGGGAGSLGPGGKGGDGIVIVRISAVLDGPIAKPTAETIVYDGEVHTKMAQMDFAYTITGTASAKDVGVYPLKVELKDGFCWNGDTSDTAPVEITWSITQAQNSITGLSMLGWLTGETPSAPSCTAAFGTPVYTYSDDENGEYRAMTTLELAALERGTYWVKATVAETTNYKGATAKTSFKVVAGPSETFTSRTTFEIPGASGDATLTDFPVLVRLSKDVIGFDYDEVKTNELRFADVSGNYLPYEIDTWDTTGESLVWVKVSELPRAGTKLSMYWGVRTGYSVGEPNDPKAVWSGYAGVWHMNEKITASQAESTASKDSTANQLHVKPQNGQTTSDHATYLKQMVSTNAVVGLGRNNQNAISSGAKKGYNWLQADSGVQQGQNFTVSGWFIRHANVNNPGALLIGAKKSDGSSDVGWGVQIDNGGELRPYITSGYYVQKGNNYKAYGSMVGVWSYMTAVYNNNKVTLYRDGETLGTGSSAGNISTDNTNPVTIGNGFGGTGWYSFDGAYDEVRIAPVMHSDVWIKTDYEQMKRGGTEPGAIYINGVARNGWKTPPSISKTAWDAGEEAGIVDPGEPLLGTVDISYRVLPYETLLDEMPTEIGNYQVVFTVPASEGVYSGLEYAIDFAIVDHSPYTGLAGKSASATAAGRVLLGNNDNNGAATIAGQAYWQVRSYVVGRRTYTNNPYWTHEGTNDFVKTIPFLLNGDTHIFQLTAPSSELCNSSRIWYLEDVRFGNMLSTNRLGVIQYLDTANYLPWSSTSLDTSSYDNRSLPGTEKASANLLLRNTVDAAIYSPCYTNGIGTIYFDVVNGSTDNVDGSYELVVEVATNVIDGVEAPVDDDIWEATAHYDIETNPDTGEVTTNNVTYTTNLFAKADFKPVPVVLLKWDYPVDYDGDRICEKELVAGSFELSVTNGGSTANFYRAYVPLNYTCPARFRIRRLTIDPSADADSKAFIALDNLIASYPTMRADLSSYGVFDETKGGKQTLGQEAAWETPFPAIGADDVLVRAKPEYYVNSGNTNADINAFITAAKLHYRWRYLNQKFDSWKSVSLDPKGDFKSLKPLDLPSIPGDIEFWYELNLQAPFYQYVDYSGTNLGVPGYTEEISMVTNRASGVKFDSQGEDWFVRLREGKSDYQALDLVVRSFNSKGIEAATTNRVEMELTGDHVWRGYLQTASNGPQSYLFQVQLKNLQEPGDTNWVENVTYWRNSEDITTLPVNGVLVDCSEEDWTPIPSDRATGYLLFQVDDKTRALTVVHADYQNFNRWNDAKSDLLFVGNSTEDEGKSGVSAKSIELLETFSDWVDMPATNALWSENFDTATAQEYGEYVSFPSATTPNGWTAGQGQWVYGLYKDKKTGRALQMAGQGYGYLQFVDAAKAPRGLESVNFSARLAQYITFNDFAYFDADAKMSMTNYTFTSRNAFDLNGNKNFSGNASLSLIAYYRPNRGCYEFRYEQQGAELTNTGDSHTGKVPGPHKKGQIYSLYRWSYDSKTGKLNTTLLGAVTNNSSFNFTPITTANSTDKYLPMYLSVSNGTDSTCIMAGVMRGGMTPSAAISGLTQTSFASVCYRDSKKERLTAGTYGVLSANCEGVFLAPYTLPAVGFLDAFQKNGVDRKDEMDRYSDKKIPFDTAKYHSCLDDIKDDWWSVPAGRMESFSESTSQWGLRALIPSQELNIYTGTAGKTDWKLLTTTKFNSFGSSQPCSFNVYTTKDCSVKIAAAGSIEDLRTDLVIDDVVLKQWRGENWENLNRSLVPTWEMTGLTNISFYSGWIKDRSILLSAKRTEPNTTCSIMSPLFDGEDERGIGLGMMAFRYHNADANTKLIFQMATNVTDQVSAQYYPWINVTNFDFSAMTETERKSGVISCYLGIHGVRGRMRLIMDPDVINAVSNVTDTTRFGSIYIDEVLCRDEPSLDSGCWWGWNLRTLGGNADGELRMFLPDCTYDTEKQGLSLVLNDAYDHDVNTNDTITYKQHLPFVQTPTFTSNIVGEVAFRARKYAYTRAERNRLGLSESVNSQPAQVTLYGSKTGDDMSSWKRLSSFIVSNETFASYSYKTEPNEAYNAFRLAVTGLDGVSDTKMPSKKPDGGYATPVRVLLDEVVVSEAVRARMAFRHVGAFRGNPKTRANIMNDTYYVPNVPSADEQPLCLEGWGVQCEVYAAQLADEIDLNRNPSVKLHWFVGDYPWGFDNWKTNAAAKSAWLSRATDTNLVYRSSYLTSPDAVIPMSQTPGTVVQYMLEVLYYQVGSSTPMTNWLSSAEWTNPSWYRPVDLNRSEGRGVDFAAYNILDTVAPYWAWINEVNLYGAYDRNYNNSDAALQYVEVAVPQEADITGWSVRTVENLNDSVVTNTLAIFGYNDLQGTKPGMIGAASNMVFRVLACPQAALGTDLKTSDGTLDGTWKISNPTPVQGVNGEISAMDPIGLQLVRPCGIIEHEIVVEGTNYWQGVDYYEDFYHPTNTVNFFNSVMRDARFFYAGNDDGPRPNSLGVWTSHGESTETWNNTMVRTPGRINKGQYISNDHPTPNGESVIVFCNVDTSFGHIVQTVGDAVETNGSVMVYLLKGSGDGTNITYKVDPWYALGTVTTNDGQAVATEKAHRVYEVNVGKGVSNNVTVTASARVSDLLFNHGITDDNRYKEAILDWLSKHSDAYGNLWASDDDEEIKLAQFLALNNNVVTNLTLTQMYWLDMDPTVGNLALKAGMAIPATPAPTLVEGYEGTEAVTNVKMGVFMMITNRTEDTESPQYGKAWAPYILRGIDPGVTSWDYEHAEWGWTGVNFKVTGILANGLTHESNPDNWIALRWFVFAKDSFPTNGPDAFISRIEVKDPYGTETPGYSAGWYRYVQENGPCPVFFSWNLDEKIKPFTVEILHQTNYYDSVVSP